MLRLLILVFGTGVAALALSGSASAGSDITVAAIATGRLYVIGTTDHPPMPVMLDEKFPTEILLANGVNRFDGMGVSGSRRRERLVREIEHVSPSHT